MIQVTCSGCGKRLNVKEEYAGRKARCPKCGVIVMIPGQKSESVPKPAPSDTSEPQNNSADAENAGNNGFSNAVESVKKPMKLDPAAIYVLLNGDKLVGVWKMAAGWQVKTPGGMAPARTNAQAIPTIGTFTFVELYAPASDAGKRLKRLSVFKIGQSDAARKIAIEPQMILSTISAYGTLTKGQKNQVLDVLKESYMREVWGGAEKIREFLTSFDAHSHLIEE